MNSQFPYPGLRPFDSTETDIFFGREEHVDELLEKLEETRFLAIIGPSGCGKSSLVRTGLFAGLRACLLSDASPHWKIAKMRPGNRPFANLAEALLDHSILGEAYASYTEHREALASLQASLNRGPFSLHEILQEFPLPDGQLLILVDQFEEIFRFYQQGNVNETAAFVTLLLNSSQHSRAPTQNEGETKIYVVITMRSDFIGDCALFQDLPEAINHGLYLTPRLNHDQLREAIELPATVFGGQIEPALITRLLNEVGNNPDQLPLLQHLLMRMWTLGTKKEGGITLTLKDYEEIGGLKNALSLHADEALAELEPYQRKIAEILFRSLSGGDSLHRDTRRPVKLECVAEIAMEPWKTVAAVVEVFRKEGRSFLMPQLGQALVADTVIDISHESLIRQWQQLKEWTQKEAEDAELYQRLESSACRRKRRQAALWRTPELELALTWREETKPTIPWAKRYGKDEGKHFYQAMRFLAESEKEQQREQREKEAARRRELRHARQQVTWAMIGLILAIVLTFWAFWERENAIQLEQKAIFAQKQAETLSINLLDSQITNAALLATRAGDYANAKKVLSENSKLYQNIPKHRLHARDLLVWFNELKGGEPLQVYKANTPLYTIAVSPNGILLAAAGKKGTLLIFDIKSGKVRHRLKGHRGSSIWTIVFHPQGEWLASAGDDKRILFWSLKTGKKIMEWQAPDEVNALAVSPDGRYFASGGKDKNVTLWEIKTGKKWHIFKGHTESISIGGIAFHPTKYLLATGSFDDTARLWDIKTKKTLHVLRGHTDDVANVIFSPDGEHLGTCSDDKMIRLWDVHSGKMLHLLHGHHRKVLGLRFITASCLVSASRDGTLRIWDIDSGITLRVLQGHHGPVTHVVHAGQIFSASYDGTVMRWNAALPFQQIIDLPSAAISSEIAPDGQSVAVGFGDGALRLYSTSNGDLLWEQKNAHKQRIRHITFNTDGNLLATASFDKTAKLWQVKEGNQLEEEQTFIGHTDKLYSVSFSPDSQILASSSYSGEIALLTIKTKESRFFKAHEDIATSVVFDSSGTRLLSAGADGHVYLWNMNDNPPTILQAFPEKEDNLAWASLSPNEKRIASVGRGHIVYIYSKEGEEQRLMGHKSTIYRAIFSHDGEQLATVCADATVRLWDLSTGEILFTLRLPTSINDNNNGYPTPLWDFDFHCTKEVCRIAVPLTRGKLLLYEMRI
jgi:WD40 repeat protein